MWLGVIVGRLRVQRKLLTKGVSCGLFMFAIRRETYGLDTSDYVALGWYGGVARALWQDLTLRLGLLLSSTFGSVLGQARLQFFRGLHLALLRIGLSSLLAWWRVASRGPTVGFLFEELVEDTLAVRIKEVFRDAHHAEDLGLDSLAALDGILDGSQSLLVHLLQVNRQTSSGVETAVALVAFEVLGLLVRDEDFLVVEVALAVVAPRAGDKVFDVDAVALFLDHRCGVVC
jgi:hypothetical protein